MDGQQVFVVPGGGRVVHLTTTCATMKRARGNYEQRTVLEVKVAAGGEPRVCAYCTALVKKKTGK